MNLYSALGFHWDRSIVPPEIPSYSIERVCFRYYRMLPEFVWDASVLEGNPFSFPEVKTLLDGVTVGGHKISDQEQILNLAESSKHLLALVKAKRFELSKTVFSDLHRSDLHRLVAHHEALEWGTFRGEGTEKDYTPPVGLGKHGQYHPLPTLAGAPELNRVFQEGVTALDNECQAFEKGLAFFLFGALQRFFFDGNKRTSRFMMNGTLMSNGIDAISVPAAAVKKFNEKMIRFYLSKEATEMMEFLMACHPELTKDRELESDAWQTSNDDDHE